MTIPLEPGECLCRKHRGRGVAIVFEAGSMRTVVQFNGRSVGGPFPGMSEAEAWIAEHMPVALACVGTP